MSNPANRSWGTTILRVVVGIVFVMHGIQKLFTFGVPAVVGMMGSLGIPFPRFSGVLVTLVELFCGLALIFGFATRLNAFLLAIDVAVAVLKVHMKNGFFLPMGAEYRAHVARGKSFADDHGSGSGFDRRRAVGRERGIAAPAER